MSTKQTDKRPGVLGRLYRGETDFQFVPHRKKFYLASAIVILALIGVMLVKGFVLGIDFAGGTMYNVPATETSASLGDVETAVEEAGAEVASTQIAGSGDSRSYIVRVGALDSDESLAVESAIADVTGLDVDAISVSEVSATWGESVSEQALIALVVFLILVSIFIWIRFERRMAVAAIAALMHDLVLTAGFYALVGFEITPSTIVGMLTILGYSLYDTVVVFDKVQENTAQLLQTRSKTFAEAVNDAINQTLMRSINTTIIGVLPVGALLFVGVGMLGVGTLRDLALVLFVGMIVGTYSSIVLAAPWLVDMAERSAVYQRHNQKIAAKRANGEGSDKPVGKNAKAAADDEDDDRLVLAKTDELPLELIEEPTPVKTGASSSRPGGSKKRRRR
jgi:preprotein translocase subunit SecF